MAYNALTHLLVDADERRPDSPNGKLDDEEIFAAWKYAKEENHITDDDPIPLDALQHVAREATEWDGDLVEQTTADGDTFDGLPSDVYNDALEAVREEYDLDPGRRQVGGGRDADAEPVAPLALERLDAVADHERERVAKRHSVEIPSTDGAREDLRAAVMREIRAGNKTVIDAPTALGKSYTVATEQWLLRSSTTGEAPVVHLHATTDARDEAAAESEQANGVEYAVLKGRKEKCPAAAGDYDPADDPEEAPDQTVTIAGEAASAWLDRQCNAKGLPFSTAHALARKYNDQGLDELPCCEEGDCPATAQWDGIPRDDDGNAAKDVVHATHPFAYVPSMRRGTNVVFDEQPDFSVTLTESGDVESETARVRSMVNAYLDEIGAPVTAWEAFIQLAKFDSAGVSDAGRVRDALDNAIGTEPPTEWYVRDPDAHAYAPDLAKAIWQALRWNDADANGRRSETVSHEPPRFDSDGESYARTLLSVVVDENNNVRSVRATPRLSQARSVIGLDAHPSMPMWHLNADEDMTRDTVLNPTPRRLWRRYERGLTVVQVGEATRPRSGAKAGEWMNDDRVRAVVDRLRDHYGPEFKTAITTAQVEGRVRSLLADVDDRVTPDSTMHFGEEKSRNDFADESAGLLYGCMDPGDDMILDALAELGLEAEPETAETEAGDIVRAKGRDFTGADADTARSVLASVRENHVAQAAGRYARNPDDPESSAVVFAMTDAHPTGFVDVETPGVEWLATDLQREIIDALAERPSVTAREIADAVDCSKRHVLETLSKLEGEELVEREEGAGDYGADVYRGQTDGDAAVDVGISEITNEPLVSPNRWSLVISPTDGIGGGCAPGDSAQSSGDHGPSDGPPAQTGSD
ncbi:hypothetical protein BRC96_09010 [Halobacteriales archaeon QS_6_64_34]|nr:MAG: hypothetical protein BRC96_09010 [Halobacteriales archaeon QS_6_64_34]